MVMARSAQMILYLYCAKLLDWIYRLERGGTYPGSKPVPQGQAQRRCPYKRHIGSETYENQDTLHSASDIRSFHIGRNLPRRGYHGLGNRGYYLFGLHRDRMRTYVEKAESDC